jgi:hypothetical protein
VYSRRVPVLRAGVQVDAVLRAADHLLQKQMRDARRQRTRFAAGETAVEIAPVRQVAGMVQKGQRIDHRHGEQRARQLLQRRHQQQATDDLHADDLVAVQRRADEQHRPRPAPVQHAHRQRHRRAGVEIGDRDLRRELVAGRDRMAGDEKGRDAHPAPRVRLRSGAACCSTKAMI